MTATQTTVLPHESALGSWTVVRREPPPDLRPYVVGFSGYRERARSFSRHLQAATVKIPLIFNLGSPFHLDSPLARDQQRSSFVAGLHDGPTLVGADGPQHCVQVDLTPLGARRIFGLPMDELAHRVIELDDLIGHSQIEEMLTRLDAAASWEARFSLLDHLLLTRLVQGAEIPPGMARAWTLLEQSGGEVRIGDLARDLGWSNKHLIAQFRDYAGLPPKTLARILRFERASTLLHSATDACCLASFAQATGYFDQAHLHRDFHQFAGITPGAFLRRRVGGLEGLVGDD